MMNSLRNIALLISLLLSLAQCEQLSSSGSNVGGLRNHGVDQATGASIAVEQQQQRRLQDETEPEKNTEGPWDFCMYLQYEICESYLLSQADDIYVLRVNPQEYDYSRIVLKVNSETKLIGTAPMRG